MGTIWSTFGLPALFYAYLGALDYLETVYATQLLGAREANPVAVHLIGNPVHLGVYKVVGTASVILVAWLIGRRFHSNKGIWLAVIIQGAAVIWNAGVILHRSP